MPVHVLLQRKFAAPQPHAEFACPPVVRNNVACACPDRKSSFPRLPRQRGPRHGRLFLLGLAGGVSDRNGDFRDRDLDRLLHACVPARTGRHGNRPFPSASPLSRRSSRPDHRHGRLPVGRPLHGTRRYDRRVPSAGKFQLAAGLMEITYDTGAKSFSRARSHMKSNRATAGYLSIGKLTARDGEERKAKGLNPQSLIPNPSFIH